MADRDPLSGAVLPDHLIVVTGPAHTGPRQTVVDTRPGAALRPWIERLVVPTGPGARITTFVDNGEPGGTYDPEAYRLPDLVATAPLPWWLWVLLGLGALAAMRSRGGKSWR